MKEEKTVKNFYETKDSFGNQWNLYFKQHDTIKHRFDLFLEINGEEIFARKFPRHSDAQIMSVYLDKVLKQGESIEQNSN